MKFLWEANTQKESKFKTLYKDISTDVIIIGGGIAGVMCSYNLHKENINYTLVEA